MKESIKIAFAVLFATTILTLSIGCGKNESSADVNMEPKKENVQLPSAPATQEAQQPKTN
jgi:hypothetical protein